MLARAAFNQPLRRVVPAAAPVVTLAARHMSGHDSRRLLLDIQTANIEYKFKSHWWHTMVEKVRYLYQRSREAKPTPRMPDFYKYPDPVKTMDSRISPIDWSLAQLVPEEDILTGDEALEMDLAKKGLPLTQASAAYGPFGTPEKPVIIPTHSNSRIAGCVGGVGKEHDLMFFMLHADEPKMRCPRCSQVFQLVVHEEEHHHSPVDDLMESLDKKYGRVIGRPGHGHGHDHGHDHDHDHGHGNDHGHGQGAGNKQHAH